MKKKYRVICYIRVDPEDTEPISYKEAVKEKEQGEFMQPENIYKIEEVKDEE